MKVLIQKLRVISILITVTHLVESMLVNIRESIEYVLNDRMLHGHTGRNKQHMGFDIYTI